ncbi:MAG: hypothetical protein JWP13_822 [Candidatus Saccharibacteria bacterium]|nr:hypothetical protein [Candidatus Saccharibacteria bacterium]
MRFHNRIEAGRLLAKKLEKYQFKDAVVYALPRGGVEVAVEVARHLVVPLDLLVPRKIGHPDHPEYAVCALSEDGYLVCNQDELEVLDKEWLREAVLREAAEAERRREMYLKGRPPLPVQGKVAIIVDDGVATGLTILAAIHDVRRYEPAKVVLALPVLPIDTLQLLNEEVEEVVALDVPETFLGAISAYYEEFDQIDDKRVISLMEKFGSG